MAMNIDLKNINVSDIKDQLTKLLADKKMVTKIGIIAGAIILFLIIYYQHKKIKSLVHTKDKFETK